MITLLFSEETGEKTKLMAGDRIIYNTDTKTLSVNRDSCRLLFGIDCGHNDKLSLFNIDFSILLQTITWVSGLQAELEKTNGDAQQDKLIWLMIEPN